MKKLILLCLSTLSFTTLLQAQTGISAAGTAPDASAMLDVIATNKGMLVPRVALVATNNSLLPIPSPADGLLVYNTGAGALTTKGFYYWDATNSLWQKVQAGNGSFVTGSGTQNYVTKWNNASGTTIGNSQIFDNGTNVGISSATPGGKLDVFGGPITLSAGYLDINRDAYAQNGISWYAQSYPSWSTYMSPGAATSTGPHGDLTAPSGTFVTSWALRNYIENAAGYGWTFESAANTTTPAVKFEIRASDGLFHAYGDGYVDGVVYAGASARMGTNIAAGYYQDATNGAYRAIVGSGTTNGYYFQTNAGGTTTMYVGLGGTYNGNVGIGNLTPLHQLSVGAATVDGQAVTIRGYSNSPASWKGGGAFGYTSAAVIMGELGGVAQLGGHNGTLGAWSTLAINSGGGNVGIGNSGPGEKLDVTGNIKATGVVYWGNGLTRTETRDDAGSQGGRSGFYETSVPAPAANWYTGASSWQHLMETRHSNTGNNYAMQIAGGFFDQDFWVRKTNNSATTAWSKMLTTSNIGTSAIQNQYTSAQTASFWVNGNAQIGSTFTNLNGRLLTSNQGGWQADGVTPQMVISANSASTNRAALIGLDLHNDNTTNNVYAPFITFSRRSNGTAYNSAFASIGAQVTGQGTDANWCAGDLIFSTENGTVNGMGERMRIDKSGRVYILQNQGNDPNFAGLDDPTSANGRAQLVLSSSYSDLVIASSEGNDNHGSTLTFASYNPANAADYRKFVINQGNWGARFGYLDFGFADAGGRTNPHSNINGTDNVITLNGINKRLGVGIMSPAQTLDVNGKARIRRGVNTMGGNANEGQLEIANTGSGDAYISFHREGAWGAQFGLESDNWFTTNGWSPGGGAWNSMRLGNLDIRGVVNCISGYCPSNNAIRMTPNLHLNNPAGNAVIINWDNGAVGGGTQQFRVGNGTGTDQFYVRADGQFYGRYFADLDDAGYYINPNGFSQTSSVYANNWFRAQNTSGFYFETYGGGWQMTDGTWIRAYNSKPILGTGGIAGYGNAVFGTPFNGSPRIYANYDNVNSGGLAISDDGGFYDFNDGWIQSRFSNGQDMRSNNTSWNTIFTMGNQDNSGLNDKLVASRNDNWGLMGGSGQAWWRGYSYGWVTSSMREKKRDITPIEGDLAALVMADIDKLKPSFYKYNAETDEYNETMPFKYRPNLHIGLILDESPDYLQDEQFSGIDNYSAATLGLLGAKVNHEEIKKLKKNVQDFGSVSVTSTTISVEFSEEFAQAISGSSLPVVTVNANVEGVIANIVEKSTTGFKVKVNKVEPGLMLDYIAMGKVLEKENIAELESKIPQEIYKGMRVDESIKQEQYKRAEQRKNDQENLEKQAGIDGERIHQERLKEIGVQVGDPAKEGAITPTISNLKTVGTDVDALIKEAQKQAEKNAPLYSPNKDEIPK